MLWSRPIAVKKRSSFNIAQYALKLIFAGLLEQISGRHEKIIELLAQGKNKEALEYYTDDCVIMPPEREAIQGKQGKSLVQTLRRLTS
jgi:hypothetical protein